jgi:hypothetical protein
MREGESCSRGELNANSTYTKSNQLTDYQCGDCQSIAALIIAYRKGTICFSSYDGFFSVFFYAYASQSYDAFFSYHKAYSNVF